MAQRRGVDEALHEHLVIERAVAQGVRDALMRHVQAGVPAAAWENGRAVWISPKKLRAHIRALDRRIAGLGDDGTRTARARTGPRRAGRRGRA